MARKTTKLAKSLIERHVERVNHFSRVLEAKDRGDETSLYTSMTKEEVIGMARGSAHMLEAMLLESNCYHGFMYVDYLGRPTTEEDEMLDWRINFIVKS